MLTNIFSTVLNMSLTANVVILTVYLARFVLKKAPKIYAYMLWGLVLFRLLCPVSFLSTFSLIPDRISSGEIVSGWEDDYVGDIQIYHDNREEYAAAVEAGREPVSAGEGHYYVVTGNDGISEPNTIENTVLPMMAKLWVFGIGAMIFYSVLSYARIRKQTRVAVPLRKNIYIADDVDSPFVMGIFRPMIYLPGTLEKNEQRYIIAHEQHHIRRGDHIFKALGFLALTIHWFNPLVWAAFVLAGRDMEMSCDEAVIGQLGEDVRAEYSASLLNLATGHRMFAGTPLAFGEGDPTGRVRNLAKWKKPKVWIIPVCVVLCIVLAVCLLTNPGKDGGEGINEYEQYYHLNEQSIVASGIAPEGSSEAVIAVKYKRTSGLTKFAVDIQYKAPQEEAWTSLPPEQLEIADTCAFQIPAGSSYTITAIPIRGQSGGYATFEISDRGLFALADIDKSNVNQIKLQNSHNGQYTFIKDEADIAQICAFLDGVFGAEYGSSKGYYEGTYSVTLEFNNTSEFYSVVFGDSPCFHLGQGEDGYPIRYELLSHDISDIVEFFSKFDSSGFQWAMLEQAEATEETVLPEYQNWTVSIQAHDVTPESLVLTYHNELDDPIWRLPGYTIQCWQDSQWIELDVGKTWYETTEQVDFNHQSNPQNGMYIQWDGIGSLPEGQYLIGQEFCTDEDLTRGQRFTVYASFEITGESGGIKPLEALPELYGAEQAMIDGCLVSRDGEAMDNIEAFLEFVDACNRGESGFFRIVDWYYGEEPHYTAFDLNYDGTKYTIRWLEDGRRISREYAYLKHFTGEKERQNMAYDAYEHYVLVNDNDVTWLDIWEGLISSQSGASIDHMTVFSDHIYYPKAPDLPDKPDYAILEFKGDGLVTVLDGDRLEKLIGLFENGEYLGYEPKTHSIGVGLNLIFASAEGDFVIELDPDNDLCRINREYVIYGKPDEPSYVLKLWEYLGITQWPDIVYTVYENALRP